MNKGSIKLGHQDWEPYIIHCREPKKKNTKVNNSIKKKKVNNIENVLESKVSEGTLKHKKMSDQLVTDFKLWRNKMNYTQKEVAIKLAIPLQIITKFENGKLNQDSSLINKIKRLIVKN